jgi:hypothetical protein
MIKFTCSPNIIIFYKIGLFVVKIDFYVTNLIINLISFIR